MSAIYINKRSKFAPLKKAFVARFAGTSCYRTRSEFMKGAA